jgi:hypothetical protein
MLKIFVSETFKEIELEDKLQFRYAISNLGRFISFTNTFEDGNIVKGSLTNGYRIWRYKVNIDGKIKHKHKILYKLVAQYHIPNTDPNKKHVIHIDNILDNDNSSNLRWVTNEERIAHQNANPAMIEGRKKWKEATTRVKNGKKLTVNQVKLIKRIFANPENKTRLKIIAKKFGVSEMQLHRIKTGENWSSVTID